MPGVVQSDYLGDWLWTRGGAVSAVSGRLLTADAYAGLGKDDRYLSELQLNPASHGLRQGQSMQARSLQPATDESGDVNTHAIGVQYTTGRSC